MTEELFREDSYLETCAARVVSAGAGGIVLDRTVFYPEGGGQPGDTGRLRAADGREVAIADTRKGADGPLHIPAEGAPALAPGEEVTAEIDWARRYLHMRVHTALHVLSSLVEGAVTGGAVGAGKGRLDFDIPGERPDKQALTDALAAAVAADHPVSVSWITDEELAANPELVRTMSVAPPAGTGRVRTIRVGEAVDFQACGGTHLASTGEIGRVSVAKIENKGRRNRRVSIALAD